MESQRSRDRKGKPMTHPDGQDFPATESVPLLPTPSPEDADGEGELAKFIEALHQAGPDPQATRRRTDATGRARP
jgi:hypothetical protein